MLEKDKSLQKEKLLYFISQLGRIKYDRLCELVFLASSKGLLGYQFDAKSGTVLSSVDLRKDLSELKQKALVVEELEKINEDFDESTHAYKITEYGKSIVNKIKNKIPHQIERLDDFIQKYRSMKPEKIEKEIMETIKV